MSDFYLSQLSTKLFAGMSDLKRISILVLVLVNVSASIAYRHGVQKIGELELDIDGERQEHPVSSNIFQDVSNLSKEFSVFQN